MFGFLYHDCPSCGQRSRKKTLGKKFEAAEKVEGSKVQWVRGGAQLKEPNTYWVHSYAVEHACELCGHRWSEFVVKQRPW